MSPEARDLIEKLLNKDHMKRLGAGGAAELKNHIFFKGTHSLLSSLTAAADSETFLKTLNGKV